MPEDITSQTLPVDADPNTDGGDTVGNVDDAGQEVLRSTISAVMGRDFKTAEDALKSVKETHKLVGSVGQIRNAIEATAGRLGTDVPGVLKLMETIQPSNGGAPTIPPAPSTPTGNDAGAEALRIAQDTARRVEDNEFFSRRPELNDYRETLSEFSKLTGQPVATVAEMPNVKALIDKARAKDEADRNLSVLHSNPRIAAAQDKMTQAKEASARGDDNTAKAAAVDAVIDAFEIGKH
jgi:hypothetical protein